MIFDTLDNKDTYSAISPLINRALNFLSTIKPDEFEKQTVEIDGKKVFALFQSYHTESDENHLFEAHNRYIDIQYLVSGEEVIRVADRRNLNEAVSYSDDKDIAFYSLEPGTDLLLKPGCFTILFPWNAHAPEAIL